VPGGVVYDVDGNPILNEDGTEATYPPEEEEEFDESTPEGQLKSSLSELQSAEELIKDPSTWEIYPGANTTEE
jgi:hypothetical protein